MARVEMASERTFYAVAALVFAASAALTIAWSMAMTAMGGMEMPGGWTMAMMWMRMGGASWGHLAASFLVMWMVMMAAMMLPALVAMLRRYRAALGRVGAVRRAGLTALVAAGYFLVWAMFGVIAFALGAALAEAAMQSPALAQAVPAATGLVVLLAGAFQFTAWKVHHLACCRELPRQDRSLPDDAGTAWRHGLRLGRQCSLCCANLMTILLVVGIMDLAAMAAVTMAITVERLAPAGMQAARVVGAVCIGAGLFLFFDNTLVLTN
ncbi:MAG: DUF2182 domain-containing protein [Parvibaculaceae bacterium]